MESVGDKYSLLIRENFLDQENGARASFSLIAKSASTAILRLLLDSRDWRHTIVGAFCAMIQRDHSFCNRLGELLHQGQPLIKRPVCLVLVVLNGHRAAEAISRLFALPYQEDFFYEYAGAFEALKILGVESPETSYHSLMTKLAAEPFYDDVAFAGSRIRFRAGVAYWQS
jgi:hypothetical protein